MFKFLGILTWYEEKEHLYFGQPSCEVSYLSHIYLHNLCLFVCVSVPPAVEGPKAPKLGLKALKTGPKAPKLGLQASTQTKVLLA